MELRSTKSDLVNVNFHNELKKTKAKEWRELVQAKEGVDSKFTSNDCGGKDRVIVADREAGRKCIKNEPAK